MSKASEWIKKRPQPFILDDRMSAAACEQTGKMLLMQDGGYKGDGDFQASFDPAKSVEFAIWILDTFGEEAKP